MLDHHTDATGGVPSDRENSDAVDFVVGPGAHAGTHSGAVGRASMLGSGWREGLRLRLALGGGAVLLGALTLVARAVHHESRPAPSHPPKDRASTGAAPTSPQAIAAVHAAFQDSLVVSQHSELLFGGRAGPTLLTRTITARIPIGTVQIAVNRAAPGADPNVVTRRSDQLMTTFVATVNYRGYSVTATLAQRAARSDPSTLLQSLAADPRLLSVR